MLYGYLFNYRSLYNRGIRGNNNKQKDKTMKNASDKLTTSAGKQVLLVAHHEACGDEWNFDGETYNVTGYGQAFKHKDYSCKMCYAYINAPATPPMHSVAGSANKPCRKCGSYCYGDCQF